MHKKAFSTVRVTTLFLASYLAGKDEAKENGDCELAVTEEDDVQQVWIGRMLEEKPGTRTILL